MHSENFEFTEEELRRLKGLCRIDCTESEEKDLMKKIRSTLRQFALLEAINTEGVEECTTVFPGLANIWRDDIVKDVIPREELLSNAPDQVGGMIRVPPVIKF